MQTTRRPRVLGITSGLSFPDFTACAQESAPWNDADSCRIGWAPRGAAWRRLAR